jgi:hypothetical protein
MSIVTLIYEAKCKHCTYFKYRKLPNKNGEWSKRMYAFCENPKSERHGHPLTLKSKACTKLEL